MRAIHLGMTVRNLQKTLDFYCNTLGAELLWEANRVQQGAQTDLIFGMAGTKVSVCGINLHGIIIEFFQFHQPAIDDATFYTTYKTAGWKHLALEVDDIQHEVERLKKQGVHFRYPIQTLLGGAQITYFDDPDGILLELIQPAAANPQKR